MIKFLKYIFFIITIIYQTSVFSKNSDSKNFNPKYLSNYLSAIIAKSNQNSQDSVKYFGLSKNLNNIHQQYLKNYIISLSNDGQIEKSIKFVKQNKDKKNSHFFEAKLLLLIDNFKKKNFYENIKLLNELESYKDYDSYYFIIYEVLKSYNDLFLTKEINSKINENFGNLTLINQSFQYCYVDHPDTNQKFLNLINSDGGDYTRYLFFYFNNLIKNNNLNRVIEISKTINTLDSNLLVQQSKEWINNSEFNKFNETFSCKNEEDIIAEFFFLISNFLSSEKYFEMSNFYSNISNYLNPEFYFNLTHLIENYFENKKYQKTKFLLKSFEKEDNVYNWYKLKKISQIIYKEEGEDESLKYIETKFKEYSYPSIKIIYDMANIYKRNKEFEKSIEYYSNLLEKLAANSDEYAEVLYRRGSSYERLKEYKNSDKDLIKSLSIKPDDPYVLNYLGYSWLERGYKIQEAIDMLNKAYSKKKNDPYIIDSVGWGYYLIGDFDNAEKFLNKAIILMPKDPIVNDHYGDVLWQLNRKIQAKYYWKSALNSEVSEIEMKKKISKKLLLGLDGS